MSPTLRIALSILIDLALLVALAYCVFGAYSIHRRSSDRGPEWTNKD